MTVKCIGAEVGEMVAIVEKSRPFDFFSGITDL